MQKQQGSAHIFIIVILIVSLLGFVFWQILTQKDAVNIGTNQSSLSSRDTSKDKPRNASLGISELGINIDLTDTPFADIKYAMTSVNSDDSNKYVVAVYSERVVNSRVIEFKQNGSTQNYDEPYWKYAANNAVYIYWYNPNQEMIDGVGDIINPVNKDSSSKLYIGFMGPADPGTDNPKLRDWLQKQGVIKTI